MTRWYNTARSVARRRSSARAPVAVGAAHSPPDWCYPSGWTPVVCLLCCRSPSRSPSTTAFAESSTRFHVWCSTCSGTGGVALGDGGDGPIRGTGCAPPRTLELPLDPLVHGDTFPGGRANGVDVDGRKILGLGAVGVVRSGRFPSALMEARPVWPPWAA